MRKELIIMVLVSMQVLAIGFAPAGVLGTIDSDAIVTLIAYRGNQTLAVSEPTESIDGQFYNQVTIEDDGKTFDMLVVISKSGKTMNMTLEEFLPWETRNVKVLLMKVTESRGDYSRPSSNEEVSDFADMELSEFVEEYGLDKVIEENYDSPSPERPERIKIMESIRTPQTYMFFFGIFVCILIAILIYIRTQVR